ncbi:MAG TPA: type I-E CRISPR-associated protein Cas7/Cse4/CasC [Candidatus Syntrophosphaera sp.]|nr:type I-E CRISPR-associated protein Cas7/Cse4/CasC [Candidatus Syntrophosphaera sp.]
MLIEIHMIQNHSPANLNRDDLGAPKTCNFGGVMRSRISSQCLKRSIRMSDEFKNLLGGIRTRRLAELITKATGQDCRNQAEEVLNKAGLKHENGHSKMLVFMTRNKIDALAQIVTSEGLSVAEKAKKAADVISGAIHSPDIALCGRMLEPDTKDKNTDKVKWENTTVEAALQVSHAISTHIARPEIDYYVAADDEPGDDTGAGFIDEAMFASACFYKYYSIDWNTLIINLQGNEKLAAHTVGAFIQAAALTNPSGKQNSFAAHNLPDGILVEIKETPVSYANAFVRPVGIVKDSDLVEQSIGQLANYVKDISAGFFPGQMKGNALWFSPNGRYPLKPQQGTLDIKPVCNLLELVREAVEMLGFEWDDVKNEKVES